MITKNLHQVEPHSHNQHWKKLLWQRRQDMC
uniref:Uncharacterized protein LOC105640478 isoform X2 n=1 Tax=Rhizophora mucronata TaxID=61149 RepID=A0A2P2PLX6_RHIMU